MKWRVRSRYIEEGDEIEIPLDAKIIETTYLLKSPSQVIEEIGSPDRLALYRYIESLFYDYEKSAEKVEVIKTAINMGIPKPSHGKEIIRRITWLYSVKGE